MKKKIIFISLLIIGLFIFTGCKKEVKEKITIKDDTLKYTTTFEYKKDDGFKFKKNVEGGRFAEIEFTNEKENLEYNMYYTESTSTTSDSVKKSRKDKKYYKEYKFDEYDAYTYGEYDDSINLIITLKSDTKEKRNTELFVAITKSNNSDKSAFDIFNNNINQEFFKSIKNTVE